MQKLPVLRLVRQSYLDVLENREGLVRVGGLWLLLPWLLGLAAAYGAPFLGIVGGIALAVGLAAIAVAWHRHILLGEPLQGPFARIDGRVGRYLLWTALMGLMMSLPLLLIGPLLGPAIAPEGNGAAAPEAPSAAVLLLPPAALALVWVAARLQLVFPGTAIDKRELGLAGSWGLTRGHGVRLVVAFMLVTVPVGVASLLLVLLFASIAQATGSIIMGALADLVGTASPWVQAPLVASLLSYVYLFLKQQEMPPATGVKPWG